MKLKSRPEKASRRRGIEFQKLEDRILFSASPVVTIDAPNEVKIGETASIKVSFDNADLTDAGYGPWVDVFIDATGADGIVDPANPANPQTGDTDGLANPGDRFDGFTLVGAPTYLGTGVRHLVLTLDDSANGGLGVLHPYAVDASGNPVYVSTSSGASPYFSTLNGSFTSGDKLLVMQLPFGSFTPDQPVAEITFGLNLSDHADINSTLRVTALGGFQFGNDPLSNPATDPSIIGTAAVANATVGADLAELTKVYLGPENETATGANYLRTYRINVDIATGQTFTNLHLFDNLPDQLQFRQISGASHAFTVIELPSTTSTGGDLGIRFNGPITGTASASDAWVDVEFYVPRVFDSNGNGVIDIADSTVLAPGSGADLLLDNQAYGFGSWDPIDPRDQTAILGFQVDGSFNPTNLTTALATASPDATPEHVGLEVSPLVVQKSFTTFLDTGIAGASPGDVLEYYLDFQISDYFAFENLTLDDVMLDGLRFDASFIPTLQINGNTFTLTALGWAAGNYTVNQNFTGAVASGNFVLDPAANDGSTALEFRVSNEAITRGQPNGKLLGGGINPLAPANSIVNDLTGYNDGATTGRITYRAQILDQFTDVFPSGEPSLNPRDTLSNSVDIQANLLNLTTGLALTAYAGPVISQDDSGSSVTLVNQQVQKTIYAINGSTNLAGFLDPSGNVNLQPGDVVTYRFTYTIPSGDIENLRFTDFLPLPVFDVDDINANGILLGLAEWSFVNNTANVAVSNFTPGVITYGPTHTLNTVSGPANASAVISIDSVTNSVRMEWDDFVNTDNQPRQVDVLLSATVSGSPFADALLLTNQVQSGEGNTQTPATESVANAIIQIVLNQPNVSIFKGVVASTQGGSVGTVGGLLFAPVGVGTFTGTLTGLSNASAIGAVNLTASTKVDAGDSVRFALVAFNTGRSDAFDVRMQDTVLGSYVNNFVDATAFATATNFKVLRGDGTVLTLGADYTLTWNNTTKVFQVELTDSYMAGNLGSETALGGLSRGFRADLGSDVSNGSNGIVALYDLTVDTDARASSTVTNTVALTNYAGIEGGGDHTAEDKIERASIVIASPEFTKVLTGTEINITGNNAANQAVVGEFVTYTLTISVAEGTTVGARIVDTMSAGLAFVDVVSTTYSAGVTSVNTLGIGTGSGAGVGPTNVTISNTAGGTANQLAFDFGSITNTDISNASAETITIVYRAAVINTNTLPAAPGNQSGTLLANSANLTWSWTNDGGTVPGGTGSLLSSAANVTVVEPHLDVNKRVGGTFSAASTGYGDTLSNRDAGDAVFFSIVITNDGPTRAFDISLVDVVPGLFAGLAIRAETTSAGTVFINGVASTATAANFILSGSTLGIAAGSNIDLDPGATITIHLQATLDYTVSPGQATINNDAVARWTSMDGVVADRSIHNTASDERGGALASPTGNTDSSTNNGILDNYAHSDRAAVTIVNPTPTKTVVSTNVASSTGGNVVVGEVIRYEISWRIPEGDVFSFNFRDNLPNGLRFLDDGTVTVAFVADSNTSISSSTMGTTPYLGTTLGTPTTFLLTAGGTISEQTPGGGFTSGEDVFFNLGTITNVENDANDEFIIVAFNVVVVNQFSNQQNAVLDNTATTRSNTTDLQTSAAVDVTVVEPTLTILKAVSGAVADAGDPISYTITISNTSGQAAYDVLLSDVLDSALTSPSIFSVTASGFTGGTFTTPTLADFEIFGSTLRVLLTSDLDMNNGSQIVITISATISNSVSTGQLIDNKSDVFWTSTDGTNPDERGGADDPNPDAATPDAGLLNNYAVSSQVTTTAVATPVVSHSIVDTSHTGTIGNNATIGEIVTYRVTVTLPEGITPNMGIDMAIPAGYAFIPGSIVLGAAHPGETSLNDSHTGTGTAAFAGSGLVSPTASRIAGVGNFLNGDDVRFTFASITTTGDNNVNNNTFSFTYQALVLDVASNDGLTPGLTTLTPTGTWTAGVTSGGVLVDVNDIGNPLARGATATVVEPELNIVKTRSVASGDAGNPLTYTLTIDHTVASQTNAYNLNLNDLLPGAFVPTGFTALIGVTDVASNFTLTGNTFATDADGVDLLLGQTLTVVFTGNISITQAPGANFNNSATLGYNTLPHGTTAQQGDFISDVSGVTNGTDRERQTADSDAVAVTVPSTLSLAKSLLSTDIAATSGANFAIGETGAFRLAVTLQQGLTSRVTVNDDLPAGLALQPGSLVFRAMTVGTTAIGAVSNTAYTDGSLIDAADFSYNSGTGVLAVSLRDVQIPATAATDTGQFAVEYSAKATNISTSNNGNLLTNSATVSADRNGDGDTTDGGETTGPQTVSITIVEPQLAINKSIITSTVGIDAGDTVTYQIVVSHLGSSASNAYELILDDILPAAALENFTLVSAQISDGATTTSVSGSFNLSGAGVLSTTGDIDLLLNTNGTNDQVLTITISTTVRDALAVGTSFTNTAGIKWSSLDGGLTGDTAGTIDERTGAGANPPNDYTQTDSVTAATVGTLGVTKGFDKANATIGEIVTYTVTVTVAEGQTVLNLTDTLPSGLSLVANSAILTAPVGWTINGFNTNSASQVLTVSNPGGSGATVNNAATADTDTFTFIYQAIVTNTLGNQSGTSLVNDLDGSADLNNDGDATDAGETDLNNTATATVVEPRVTIDKTAVPVSGLNAGDVVTYTVTLNNLAANGATSSAFDVALSDTVPGGLLITGISSTTLNAGSTQDVAASINGGGTGLSGQFDIPVGGSVVIVYTATVQASIVPGQSLVNDADATFTSLNGTVTGERDGSGVAEPTNNTHPDDGGILNNYGVGDTITVTALSYAPLVTKAIVATSEAGSTGSNVLVGEIVRYSLKFELFEGTLNDLVIRDFLPPGLQFLTDETVVFFTLNVDTSVTNTIFEFSDSASGGGTIFTDGTDVFFQLGTVVNNDNDADVEYWVIEFNALVLNTVSNQNSVALDNNFAVLYDADNNAATAPTQVTSLRVDANDDGTPETTGQSVSNTVTVTVQEAALNFNQVIPAGTGYDAGDTFTITYTITNNGSVPAYNVRLADTVLPAEFDLTNVTFVTTGTGGAVTDSTNLTSDSIDAEISQIAAGSTWTITATVTLRNTVNPSDVYTNPADVSFTSLPGANGTPPPNGTGSETPGTAGSATGERTGADGVGGALNDYALADTESLSIPNPFIVTKVADRSTATIGEVVTYTVEVTVIEGTTANIVLNDTLPAGMSFVAGSATITSAAGMTINGFNANSLGQSLSSVVNPGANEASANTAIATGTFIYTYRAVVLDVAGNDGITASGDGDGQTSLVNDLDASADGVSPDNDNTATVTVVEPRLEITKANNDLDGVVVSGQVVTYTLTISNLASNGSAATAYDVRVRDLVPASLVLTVGSINVSGATVVNDSSAGNTLDLTLDSLALGSTATITFTATVGASVSGGDIIDNNAKVFYDSLPDNEGAVPGTGNTVFGDADGTSGDRDYGSTGPDEVHNLTTDIHQDTERLTVGTFTLGDRVWFDLANFGVQDPGEAGIGGVTVTLLYAGQDGIFGNGDDVAMGSVDTTAVTGAYLFSNLANGNYRVTVDSGDLPDGVATVATFDLDGLGTPNVSVATISGSSVNTVDFGYRGTSSIGDTIYFDANNDGDQDAGELGLSGVDVTARWAGGDGILDTADDVVLSTTTNASGSYSFANLFSGPYRVDVDQTDLPLGVSATPTSGGSGANISVGADPLVLTGLTQLAIGEARTTVDFGYTGTGSLGDFVFHDFDGDGVQDVGEFGLANIGITLTWGGQDGNLATLADNVVYTTTTNATGGYLFSNLAGGSYRVDVTETTLSAGIDTITAGAGSVGADPFTLSLGAAENNLNVDFGYRGAGSVGDRLWYDVNGDGVQDAGEVGISGASVELVWAGLDGDFGTTADNITLTTLTDSNGNYLFANLAVDIAGGINTGQYQVSVATATLPAGVTTPTFDVDGTGTPNIAVLTLTSATPIRSDVDFGYRGSGAIGNRVYHDTDGNGSFGAGDLGLANVDVNLRWAGQDNIFGTADDVTYSTTTDAAGNYGFSNLVAGDFRVDIDNADLPTGITTITSSGSGSDVSVGVDPFTTNLTSGENDQTVDFGYRGTGSIGDRIFADINGDGILDPIDYGLTNVEITVTWAGLDGDILTVADNVVYTVTTDSNGNYTVSNLAPGQYSVQVTPGTLPSGYSVPTFDLDGTGTPNATTVSLTNGQNREDGDFGYRGTGRIADTVWLDLDNGGTQNGLEPGIGGVTLDLIFDTNNNGIFDAGDVVVAQTTTAVNGFYEFTGLVPDRYLVRVTDTGSILASATNTFDKDDYGTVANNGLAAVELSPAENDSGVDFGYRGAASIGDRVWNDLDADGIQDLGEFGAAGITVNLYRDLNGDGDYTDAGEGQIGTTTTGANGAYLYGGLIAGNYIVEVVPPANSTNTFEKDDDVPPLRDNSAKVTLGATETDMAVDFGYQGSASISDYVWFDANSNGLQDLNEPPIPGVRVFLDINGNGAWDSAFEPSATTDGAGIYGITGLIGGSYTARVDVSTLPAGYIATFDRDGSGSPDATSFVLLGTQNLTDVDWGYIGTLAVSGRSYHDRDKNGVFDGTDTGLGGVTIELISDTNNDGIVDAGDFIVFTTVTAPDGTYSFSSVISGNYLVRETQLAGYGSQQNVTNLIDVTVAGVPVTGQNFGNTTGSISGTVYSDLDDDGIRDLTESGIAGAAVRLEWTGADGVFGTADDRSVSIQTDALGNYTFNHTNTNGFVANGNSTSGLLSTGSYRVIETTPTGFIDGADAAGDALTPGTVAPGSALIGRGADSIAGIQIGIAQDATGYLFGEIRPSSIAGSVHEDSNNNGQRDPGEAGIPNSLILLEGVDTYGRSVSVTTLTDANGDFNFGDLYASGPAGYTLFQLVQPPSYNDGLEGSGSVGGNAGFEVISNIVLGTNVVATDYTFGETLIPPPPVQPTTQNFLSSSNSSGGSPFILSSYFYNAFENFLGEPEDEDLDYLLEEPIGIEPILPLMPLYSGHAEPGSTIVMEIRNVVGSVIGTETVVADAGGNWLAKFASSTVYDTPTSVSQTVTRASYSTSQDDDFNFRTNFSPAINPSHFFTQPLDVDGVFSESDPALLETINSSLNESQSDDWNGFNYEFLAEPGVPSS